MQKNKIKANIDQLVNNLKRHSDVLTDDETKDEIKFMVEQVTDEASSIGSKRVNQSLHTTLNNLSKDPNIKVCRYGKGNDVAIINTEDCHSKLDKLVKDKSKFMELKEETGIKAIIRNLKNNLSTLEKYPRTYD